ncbi:helix-turn-helix transcriptional regulator [Streptomyces sp. NK08204]|uniref:helix-turn-helix transcriptional regulator n=1 Tax=Streptomyces sp. NK08204 TaxID=2873260 RepID=UPI001CEC63AB|nr:helix-turn-helix transcriptional regulator [Streptomyces sp. NK08204]
MDGHGREQDASEESSLLTCVVEDCVTAGILTRAHARWQSGSLMAGIALAEEAIRAECGRCGRPCSAYASLLLTLFLASIRRVEAAADVQRRLLASAEVQGDPELVASTRLVGAKVALAAGDYADAAALAEQGLRLAAESGQTAWTPVGNLVLATTTLRRGDISAALHYSAKLEEDAVFAREMFPTGQSAWAIVQLSEAGKGRDKAAALARELLESETLTRRLLLSEPAAVPWLVRLMLRVGERGPAGEGVRFAERLAAENPDVDSVGAAALHAAALLEGDLDKLRRAAESHTDPWARASVLEDIGVRLCEGRVESPEAATYFERAMRAYTRMGSLRDSSRVMSRLRGINASPLSRERCRPRSGIQGLTDTEYAVAKLVSRGLTNGETAEQMFLSRHTVAFHLRKVFQKVGVKSRLELAVIWNELDTGPAGPAAGAAPALHGTRT